MNGTLDELKRQVLGAVEYEATFANDFDPRDLRLPPGVTLTSTDGTRLRFQVEAPQVANPSLVKMFTSHNASLVSLQEVPRRLEHVYLKTMADAQGVIYAT